MAKAKKPVEADDTPAGRKRAGDKAILEEARENFKLDLEADETNRKVYRESMKFCYEPGCQWEEEVKRARGKKRITREFNETRVKVKSVVNHIRANRPAAKITPVEEGDIPGAEARQGIWLNILNRSKMDDITDFAAETQVAAGMGAWFVDTEYAEDSVRDQDILIRSIRNPLCLVPDRAAKEQDKSDARHWNYFTSMSKGAYESKYGKADKIASFDVGELNAENDPNSDEDSVWLSAYWRKEPYKKTLCLLTNGQTVVKDEKTVYPEGAIVDERTFTDYKIVQYICSADSIIERNEWAGKHFPFVIVYGEYVVIDGKTRWSGLTQTMIDAQRSHNETLTGVYETIAASPQAKYWATAKQGAGLLASWQQAVDENLIAVLYNTDEKNPGPPVRVGGADVPAALIQAAQMSRDSMKSVSGIFDASLGETSNETSGKAIRARTDQALIVTYNYSDNGAKAIGRTCEIVMDLIPKVIDTERAYRILGADGAPKYITVNKRDPMTGEIVENDLSRGKYDFVVTQGPNLQTQRQEAVEFYSAMSQSNPALQQVAGDVIFENSDIPGAKQVAERLKAVLPAPIQALLSKDKAVPPEVAAGMAQVEQGMAMVQEQGQLVQQAAQEAQVEKNAADKAKADVAVQQANLKVMEAELNTAVAQFKQLVAETQAKQAQQMATDTTTQGEAKTAETEQQSAALIEGVASALENIQSQTAQLLEAQAQQIAALAQFVTQPKAPLSAVTERVNGGYVTTTSDGRRVVTEKQAGKLVTNEQQTVQ